MKYLLVQPYADGLRKFEQATVVAEFSLAADAFRELELYGVRLRGYGVPADSLELFVVNEKRQLIVRGH